MKINSLDETGGATLEVYWINPDNANAYIGAGFGVGDKGVDHMVFSRSAGFNGVFEHEFVMPATDSNGGAITHATPLIVVNGAIDFQIAQWAMHDLTAYGA